MSERKFKGVWIPKKLWFDEGLSPNEKIMLLEIDSLDKGGGCYASNRFFAKRLKISTGGVANIITKLRRRKMLVTRKKYDGRKRFVGVADWVKKLYKI